MKIRIEISDDAISWGMTVETDANIVPQDLIYDMEQLIDKHIGNDSNEKASVLTTN